MSINRSTFEFIAVFLTAIGKILFINVWDHRAPYIVVVLFFWTAYAIYRYRLNKSALNDWGLGKRGFKSSFMELLPIVSLSLIGFFIYACFAGHQLFSWGMLVIFIIYPIWGILQQFLVLSVFGQNLKNIMGEHKSSILPILLTALLFGGVHYPYVLLIVGTFFLALVYTYLFFKGRNLLVMGLFHGWLATFFFYWVLDRDPWMEAFVTAG